jgi:short subunit fatty acids transporter
VSSFAEKIPIVNILFSPYTAGLFLIIGVIMIIIMYSKSDSNSDGGGV